MMFSETLAYMITRAMKKELYPIESTKDARIVSKAIRHLPLIKIITPPRHHPNSGRYYLAHIDHIHSAEHAQFGEWEILDHQDFMMAWPWNKF